MVASGRIGAVRQIHLESVQGHAAARDTAKTAWPA